MLKKMILTIAMILMVSCQSKITTIVVYADVMVDKENDVLAEGTKLNLKNTIDKR